MALQTIIPNFQAGFRLIDGSDLNKLVTQLNAVGPDSAYNTATNTTSFTATGAQVSGGRSTVMLNLTGTLGGAANITLPTVAQVVAALQANGIQPQVNDSYELDILNTSSGNFAWTVLTATGWTLTGTMTIAQNTMRRFIVTFTAVGSTPTATLQSLGGVAVTAI